MIFGAMIFLIGNLVLVRWYSTTRQGLSDRIVQLEQAASEYRLLLDEAPRWQARQQWIEAHPLEDHRGSESDSRFAEQMQQAVTQNGLVIDSQQLHDSAFEDGLVEAQLEFTVKGRLEQVVRWLNQIQQPGNHLVVQAFTLRRLDEGDAMVVRIRIGKIFRVAQMASNP